jgi:excisionase family DNA binding protein
MPAAQKIAPPGPITQPLSIAGLATRLGVSRQRVYALIRNGRVKATQMSGGWVIAPEEASRIADAAVRINIRDGRSRVVFDFI